MTLPRLTRDEFPEFFAKLNRNDQTGEPATPFRWQCRLATQVASKSRWPAVLGLPTGVGKTTAIDIALFHLALEAHKGERRRAPLRIILVVDRRVVVNGAYQHASQIEERLRAALALKDHKDVLYRVARRLAHLSDGGIPVIARALLGGVPREDDWARTPCQPTILCSTVDQVGSRLLFRGYGVSDSMKPVHAGLCGGDCLIFLDEAHLSEPFNQTLEAIERYRRRPWTEIEPAPWTYVKLSATPTTTGGPKLFSLLPTERADPALAPRLSTAKPVELVLGKARSHQHQLHASELVDHAWRLSGLTTTCAPQIIIALVVNRVSLARRCHEELSDRISKSGVSAESALFIGRTRDIDRQALMQEYEPRLKSGHPPPDKTLFVVATQCIEAGADFDFNTMVTQAAPLDVIRQRFGRVNRLGKYAPMDAVILACRDEVDARAEDPLYGIKTKAAWDWLMTQSSKNRIDLGINALDKRLKGKNVSALTTATRDAPTLMPAYIDLWAQTYPIPAADPEPALFLHGAPETADVHIVWRADIAPSDLQGKEISERALRLLSLMPPKATEAVSVPIYAARAWLSGRTTTPITDVEGISEPEPAPNTGRRISAVRWRGSDSDQTDTVMPRELRSGDLVVVASAEGGCDQYGWLPGSPRRVPDVGEVARKPFTKQRFVFRIHRHLLEDALQAENGSEPDPGHVDLLWRKLYSNLQEARNAPNCTEAVRWLLRVDGLPREWLETLRAFEHARSTQVEFPYDDDDAPQITGLALIAPRGIDRRNAEKRIEPATASTESDENLFQGTAVLLADHARHVADKAQIYARCAGLQTHLVEAIKLAAYLHDEGKKDSRFQLYLRRGDRLEAATNPAVLAKSNKARMDRTTERRVRERTGLPTSWRHEADSVRRALRSASLKAAHDCDRDLVLWLVGTHHGYGRPLYPHTDPLNSGPQDLSFQIDGLNWAEIFAKLLRQYGAWELARFEAIVRLADHRASEAEQLERSGQDTNAKVA